MAKVFPFLKINNLFKKNYKKNAKIKILHIKITKIDEFNLDE